MSKKTRHAALERLARRIQEEERVPWRVALDLARDEQRRRIAA